MKPIVSIIMGSTSDLPVMEKAAVFLDSMDIPFEMNALSAHRTPAEVENFAREAAGRGVRVILAGAGMAAALPGVIAANTTLPVIGIPIKGMVIGEVIECCIHHLCKPEGIRAHGVQLHGGFQHAVLMADAGGVEKEIHAAKVFNKLKQTVSGVGGSNV